MKTSILPLALSALLAAVLGASAQYAAPAIPLSLNSPQEARPAAAPARLRPAATAEAAEPARDEPAEDFTYEDAEEAAETTESSRPWWAFWRSDDADDAATAEEEEEKPFWIVETVEGDLHEILLDSLSLQFDAPGAPVPFDAAHFNALFTIADPADPDRFAVLLPFADARPFAVVASLPSSLKARTRDGQKLSLDWEDILSVRDPAASAAAPQVRIALQATVLFDGDDEPATVEFPVALLPFKLRGFDLRIPTWNIESICVNPDRTVTLVSRFGDILTGELPSLRKLDGFDKALRVDFKPIPARFAPKTPDGAFRCRLRSGDVLVAVPDPDAPYFPELAAPAASSAPAVRSLRATAATAAADAPSADLPVLLPFFRNAPVLLPGAIVETTAALDAPLPPASSSPWSPSARLTDELFLPAASFHLGCAAANAPANESPSVEVAIDPVFMARTPVTVAQYATFVAETGYTPAPEARSWDSPGWKQSPLDPVVAVSWRDAVAYCNWLSRKAGLTPAYALPPASRAASSPVVVNLDADGYRLPLEAEWEFAARDLGKPISFPWGDDATEETALAHANFVQSAAPGRRYTSPVLAYPPSPLGFYDLAGNAAEWCQDAYLPDAYATAYQSGDLSAILNPANPAKRVIRGGSYLSPLVALRTTSRAFGLELVGVPNEENPRPRVGFRVVRNAP